ncbi:hypothetical protein BYT27DRAFT_7225275 [Phlegmacium glaucopus]|nr:hypothetical protein BYT27DRAFT_7225275 [Phlegmacium glaucopus]
MVGPEESVIFYTKGSDDSEIVVELAVIHGIGQNLPVSDKLYTWLSDIVDTACGCRRNIRPTHPGHMSQVGLNLGPRHARVLGWAKSYTQSLDKTACFNHDQDAIGAASISWSLFQAAMPQEVVSPVYEALSEAGLPCIATRMGYSLQFENHVIEFPDTEHAPPESYFSRGYEAWAHVDPSYCKYAFNLCVNQTSIASNPDKLPGATFVDVDLRVAVLQSPATGIGFQPARLHGTTLGHGTINHNISITFSQRVADAWSEATGSNKAVISGEGAGEGAGEGD